MIAVEYHGDILLKAEEATAPAFEPAGAIRWSYDNAAGKTVTMPYWSIPADAFDDPETMAHWVKLAHEAALRSARMSSGGRRRNADRQPSIKSR
jgi:DNA transformation protein